MLHTADMGRPKKYQYPPNMTFDRANERYVVRNPKTKKSRTFVDESLAVKTAKALNELIETDRRLESMTTGLPTIAGLVAKWESDRMPLMAWDEGTKTNMMAKMRRISREMGHRTIKNTDSMCIEDWISAFCDKADTFNKWRYAFVLLWKFGVSRQLAEQNEPKKIEERSTSKKLQSNQKDRQPLDLAGFWAIHEKAPAWLQLAMEQSLITLQGRSEICNMRHTDHRDGYLFVIRDKVSGDSDMAFIKIALTPQLLDIQSRARQMYSIASPFLIHRKAHKNRREWTEGKPHWSYINPDYLTKSFARARDLIEQFAGMPSEARPTFHEIRGLGSRIYLERGMSQEAIQALMSHASKRTTQIYLEGGLKALTDGDYLPVVAPLALRDLK